MDTHLHPLPPRKRLGLLQKQRDQELRYPMLSDSDYALPAKKRNRSRRPPIFVPETATFPLPTKKRVWAFRPDCFDMKSSEGLRSADHQRGFADDSICEDDGDYSLPAKKRRDSRAVVCVVDAVVSVPIRKRVCALEPDFVLSEMFDLNVEYKPSVGEDCKIESNFGDVEITVRESSEVVEEVGMSGGFVLDDRTVEHKIRDAEECPDLEIVSNFGSRGDAELTESRNSGVVEKLDLNDMFEIEGRPAGVESREEKKSMEGIDLETVSSFVGVEVTNSETNEVVEELGNADAINEAAVNIFEEKDSVECAESGGINKFNGGVAVCGHDGQIDACFEREIDGNGDKLVSGDGESDNNLSPGEVGSAEEKGSGEGLHLEIVSNFGNVQIDEKETSEVVEGQGIADETNQFGVNNSEEKDSVECVDLVSIDKVYGGVHGCGHDADIDACFEGATDGSGDKLLSGDGVVAESVSDHLEKVNSSDSAVEGDSESEDGVLCEICQSTDGDPSDPIVFCDGCDLMAHASCYGNPLIQGIPEGDWFCDKCAFQVENPSKDISCCLCPSTGGVLKATNDGRWAHIVCAVFVPEAFFLDPHGREGINVSKIYAKRWKKRCYVCEKRKGCVIDCSEAKCCLSFHVTCGLKEDLCIEYREGNMKKGGIVAGFCKDHTELWKKQQQTGKFKIVARKSDEI